MDIQNICPHCMEAADTAQKYCPCCGGKLGIANEPHQLPVGVTVNGRYLIGKCIGEGGFGITYVGRDLNLGWKVAVKEFYPAGMVNRFSANSLEVTVRQGDPEAVFRTGKQQFFEEARTLAKFAADPSIVCVRDFFTANNTAYIVMEYLEGISLRQYLQEHGPLSFERVYQLLSPIMAALEKVHAQGLIHRDISPSNLMLLDNGSVKLLDFGTARIANDSGEKSLSVVLKPGFAPEEQYRSHGEQGPWTDVYALCATMYKLITGKTPENAMNRLYEDSLERPSACGASITPAQEQVLLRGMAVRRADRIQSMAELQAAFLRAGQEASDSMAPEPDTDDERTLFAPEPIAQKARTAESKPLPALQKAQPETTAVREAPKAIPSERKEEAKPERKPPMKQKPPVKEKSAARRKSGKKKKVLSLVLGIVVVCALVVAAVAYSGIDQYEDTNYARIADTTVTTKMLKTINRDSNITKLIFSNCILDDEIIQNMADMKRIQQISFSKCSGCTTLAPLAEMTTLESLKWEGISSLEMEGTSYEKKRASLDGNAFFPVQFPALKELEISNCQLADTSFLENFPAIQHLTLSNLTGTMDASFLSAMPDLEFIRIYEVDIRGKDLSALHSCEELETAYLEGLGLSDISWAEGMCELSYLVLDDNAVASLEPLHDCEKLTLLSINRNKLTDLDGLAEVPLYSLEATENAISDISALTDCVELRNLDISGNQVSDISALTDCVGLWALDISGNQVSDISALASCTELQTLNICDNQITELSPLSGCTAMKSLYMDGNRIPNLDFCEAMVDLTTLSARDNQIQDISGLRNTTQLQIIALSGNQIGDISAIGKNIQNLKIVLLDNNEIADISALSGSTKLESLTIENNQITNLDALSGSAQLKFLTASGNQITDIFGLGGCTALSYLDLGENQITDISVLFTCTASKQAVLLQNNQITDISPLCTGTRYVGLSLYNNPISDFSRLSELNGDRLYVSWADGWDETQIISANFGGVSLVDVPLDQQAELKKKIKAARNVTPTFLSTEQADAEVEEFRATQQQIIS